MAQLPNNPTRWNPARYGQFVQERAAPFFDLISRITAEAPRRIVDLGCGPGNLTATLADRWPDAEVVGLDSSAEMLAAATAQPELPPNLRFERADISGWMPSAQDDVVVTNAALQWVPGHRERMPQWFAALPDGGTFAMQVPANFSDPSHTLLREQVQSNRWQDLLGHLYLRDDSAVGSPTDYLDLALDAGLSAQVWETRYFHLLHGENAVLDWGRGTRLLPVLAELGDADAEAFEDEYAARLREVYPAGEHGTVYPFLRLFLVATKDAAVL